MHFDNVRVGADDKLGGGDDNLAVVEQVMDIATAALVAESVGAMEALQKATLEYLKTRRQFGVPIGKFQALQHRMVDMLMYLEQSRSMAYLAAVKVQSSDVAERQRVVSAAKNAVGRYGRLIAQDAIQMHGGMGITDELSASHYFRRLTAIDATLGRCGPSSVAIRGQSYVLVNEVRFGVQILLGRFQSRRAHRCWAAKPSPKMKSSALRNSSIRKYSTSIKSSRNNPILAALSPAAGIPALSRCA